MLYAKTITIVCLYLLYRKHIVNSQNLFGLKMDTFWISGLLFQRRAILNCLDRAEFQNKILVLREQLTFTPL